MNNQTAATAIERAERRAQAVHLRREGLTLREVADRLGVSVYTAWNDIQTAVRDIPKEEADLLRQQEADRLDNLQRAVWDDAIAGDLHAVDRVLKIIERRCRLLGLDAPTRIEYPAADLDLDAAVRDLVTAARGKTVEGGGWAVDVVAGALECGSGKSRDEDFIDYTADELKGED